MWNQSACRYQRVKLQRQRWKKQRETIWGRQRLKSFSVPELAALSNVCVGPSQMCLLKPAANPVATVALQNGECHKGKRCSRPEMQEEEPAADDVTALGQSGKQSRDSSPSIGACLLLLNCKNGLFHSNLPLCRCRVLINSFSRPLTFFLRCILDIIMPREGRESPDHCFMFLSPDGRAGHAGRHSGGSH